MMNKFLSLLTSGALVVVAAPAALANTDDAPGRFDKVAEHFNLSTEELQAELDSGKTLRDVAIENGMTQDQVKQIRQKRVKHHRKHVLKEQIAETLGMTKEELLAEKEAGKTLKEVAEEQGVALEELKDLFHSFRMPVRLHFISEATGESVDTLRDQREAGTLQDYLISLGFDMEDLKAEAAEARDNR